MIHWQKNTAEAFRYFIHNDYFVQSFPRKPVC